MTILIAVLLAVLAGLADRANGGAQWFKTEGAQTWAKVSFVIWPALLLLATGEAATAALLAGFGIRWGRSPGWTVIGYLRDPADYKTGRGPSDWERWLGLTKVVNDPTDAPDLGYVTTMVPRNAHVTLAVRSAIWGLCAAGAYLAAGLLPFVAVHAVTAAVLFVAWTVGCFVGSLAGLWLEKTGREPKLPAAVAGWLGVPVTHWTGAWNEFLRSFIAVVLMGALL